MLFRGGTLCESCARHWSVNGTWALLRLISYHLATTRKAPTTTWMQDIILLVLLYSISVARFYFCKSTFQAFQYVRRPIVDAVLLHSNVSNVSWTTWSQPVGISFHRWVSIFIISVWWFIGALFLGLEFPGNYISKSHDSNVRRRCCSQWYQSESYALWKQNSYN